MKLGKSIRIYLKEGSVTGIKLAEVVNLTIQALSCPRNKLLELNESFSDQVNTQGVYFLLGEDEETARPKVYIGEAENVLDRLKNHLINKSFWNEVILFTSKDENITKSHIKYLEGRLVEIAKQTGRYNIENSLTPAVSRLPLPDRDSMEEFINNIKLLNGVLGHKFLEYKIKKNEPEKLLESDGKTQSDEVALFLSVKDISAKAFQTDEGIVVLKGSKATSNPLKKYGYRKLRDSLVKEGIITYASDGEMEFNQDFLFKSPSAAAAVIIGYAVNGRTYWKNTNGLSLKEIEEKEMQ